MPSSRSFHRSGVVVVVAAAVAGCGTGAHTASATTVASASCTNVVNSELVDIARRIYGQEAHGRDVVGAVARVERSAPLAAAVARDDPAATRAALQPLLRADILRIQIERGSRVLASFGDGAALAPVRGSIRDAAGITVGRFTLATGSDAGVASLIEKLTGAQVVMRSGQRVVAGALPTNTAITGSSRASLSAEAFPSGPLQIELLSPPADPALCGASAAATVANTIGDVGRRLLASEATSSRTRAVLREVAGDPRFISAVEARDPDAVRAQIVRFFQDPHLHVVRVRALDARGQLINDVGGPYVLAPASTAVLSHGHRIGTVTLSIQDDTGYIKLIHGFTGADIVMRAASGVVPGSTLSVGTAELPSHGAVSVQGRRYEAYSFNATAFPAGPLRISLLDP